MTDKLIKLLSNAENGDPEAAFMASHLLSREGGTAEMVQTQLRRAAEGGYLYAQRELAFIGLFGKLNASGVTGRCRSKRSRDQGLYWLNVAVEGGDVLSMLVMSDCYRRGLYGVPLDDSMARQLRSSCAASATEETIFHDLAFIMLLECSSGDSSDECIEHWSDIRRDAV